jgi:hypothetical protein
MKYQKFSVRMPDPRVAGLGSSAGPSSGPELVNGLFHVVSKKGRQINDSLAKLAGTKVSILGLESEKEFTQDDIKKMGLISRRKLRTKGIITQLIPDYSADKPFQK